MKTLYISGPMTGYAGSNYAAFNEVAARLRAKGFTVENPAENFNGEAHHPREAYMKLDIARVLRSDAVAVLPLWNSSNGARLEVAVACAIGLPILYAETLEPVPAWKCRLEVVEEDRDEE
jgi:hypothetical protein